MSEKRLHESVCDYLKYQYPDTVFTSDASGLRLNMGQAIQIKKLRHPERGIPDLIILEPRGGYNGMLLELKVDTPFKKDGSLKKNDHLEDQADCLFKLTSKGYYAHFAIGFDDAKEQIDKYMNQTHTKWNSLSTVEMS